MTYTREVIAWLVLRARLQGLVFLVGAAGSFAAVFVFAGVAVLLFGDAKSWETL